MRKRALLLALALLLAAALNAAGLAEMIDLSTPLPQAEATPAPNRAPQLAEAPLEDVPPLRLDCAAAMLVEPESGFWAVLLSNRVYPTRNSDALFPFRRRLHSDFWRAFEARQGHM